jgi:hypothetical protein
VPFVHRHPAQDRKNRKKSQPEEPEEVQEPKVSEKASTRGGDDAADVPVEEKRDPPLWMPPFVSRTTLAHLDAALDRLALTPAPFRKRILQAFAAALAADGTLSATEAELLRAIAAALDCPLPPMLE